jgi:hypothetical protein
VLKNKSANRRIYFSFSGLPLVLLCGNENVDYFCVAAGTVKVCLFRLLELHGAGLCGVEGVIATAGNVFTTQDVVASLTDDYLACLCDLTVVNLYTKSFTL